MLKSMVREFKKEVEQKLIKADKINTIKNGRINKEKILEEKVYKILQRTAKGVAKIGKVKYNKLVSRSPKDADKAKQVVSLLVKRIYTVEVLLRDYIKEVDK